MRDEILLQSIRPIITWNIHLGRIRDLQKGAGGAIYKARGGKLSARLVFGLPRDSVVCITYSWSFQQSNSPHKLGDSLYEGKASGVNKSRESSLFT